MMAVTVYQRFARELRNLELRRLFLKKFAEKKRLPLQPARILNIRQQVNHLVAEHRCAARFQNDHRHAILDGVL